jgi:hypothetical protein
MTEYKKFRVIEGGGEPPKNSRPKRKRKKRVRGEPELLVCHKCNSTATIEVKLGRFVVDGKTQGGTKQLRCAECNEVLI